VQPSGHDAAAALGGDRRALARALTLVENDPVAGARLLAGLRVGLGRAHRVGVTGPPGAGKSTLVSALIGSWRRLGRRVGVLAVDPSSAFTGGALLGDRIRMTQHLGDDGVFVRSLASRGASGGLAAAAEDLADVLDAAGYDPVVIETVGVGQGEMDVVQAVDTTVLVLAPGGGDDVQALKAGLIEMADVVVVNQADRAGADRMEAALKAAFELRAKGPGLPPEPPVLLTTATTGAGVEALREALDVRVGEGRAEALGARRLERARRRIVAEVDRRRAAAWWHERADALAGLARDVASGRLDCGAAASRLLSGEA
jgi:LAO/AO transport system kinase